MKNATFDTTLMLVDMTLMLLIEGNYTIRIDSTPTFLYFDLYLYSGYGAHYIYLFILSLLTVRQYELVSSFGTDTQEHTLGTAFIEIRFP